MTNRNKKTKIFGDMLFQLPSSPFKYYKVKFKHPNQKPIFDFKVDGNFNAGPICHFFHSPKVGDLDH